MITKGILIIVAVFLGLLILIPLALNMSGSSFGPGFLDTRLSYGQKILISYDGGISWRKTAENISSEISDIAFDPRNPNIVFLGSKNKGLWQSTNRGQDWQKIEDESGALDSKSRINKIIIARSDPKIIFLAAYQSRRGIILKSADGGKNFKEIYRLNPAGKEIFDIYANIENRDNLLASTEEGDLLETINGGETWKVKDKFNKAIVGFETGIRKLSFFYAFTSDNDIYKIYNEGQTVAVNTNGLKYNNNLRRTSGVSLSLEGESLREFTVDKNNPQTIYAVKSSGLTRSLDGGTTWKTLDTLISGNSQSLDTVAVSPANSNIIFTSSGSQLYKSVDGGTTWKIISVPSARNLVKIYINPLSPETIIALAR